MAQETIGEVSQPPAGLKVCVSMYVDVDVYVYKLVYVITFILLYGLYMDITKKKLCTTK